MIANSVLFAMMFTISACFFTPLAIIAWLMIKKRAKRIGLMLMFGALAAIGRIVIQMPIVLGLNATDGYSDMPYYLNALIGNVVYAGACVVSVTVLLLLIKKNGLNYNRAWTISAGFGAVDVIAGTGVSYFAKIILASSINDGTIYDTYENSQAQSLIDNMTSTSVMVYVSDALAAIASMFICAVVVLLLVYGIANNKLSRVLSISFVIMYINLAAGSIIANYAGAVAAIIFKVVCIAFALYLIIRISKKADELVIKPESMLNKA